MFMAYGLWKQVLFMFSFKLSLSLLKGNGLQRMFHSVVGYWIVFSANASSDSSIFVLVHLQAYNS